MKQNWQMEPVPPPETSSAGIDGFIAWALLAFVLIGPLIYFRNELGAAERYVIGGYRVLEGWLLPIKDWFLGLLLG